MAVKINSISAKIIGPLTRFHRKQAGLSRKELADIAGVGKTLIYDIEKGKKTVRLNPLLKVFTALNLSLMVDGVYQRVGKIVFPASQDPDFLCHIHPPCIESIIDDRRRAATAIPVSIACAGATAAPMPVVDRANARP